MIRTRAGLALLLWSLISAACWAQSEVGHYQPGVVNAKDFIVPEPGWYYNQYDTHYHSGRFNDEHGKKTSTVTVGPATLAVQADVDYFAVSPTLTCTSPWEVLGGRYAAFISLPFQSNGVAAELSGRRFGISAEETTYGLGDIQVQPVWLGWERDRVDLAVAFGFFPPSGRYTLGSPDNLGAGFWSPYLQASLAWYLTEDKGTGFYFTATYEFNGKKEGEQVTGGDHLYLEYSLSRAIGERVEIALCGTSLWQTTRDHGSDVTWDRGILDQAHALGGQLAFWLIPGMAQVSLNAMWEYETQDRFRGYFGMLNLLIAVDRKPAPPAKTP